MSSGIKRASVNTGRRYVASPSITKDKISIHKRVRSNVHAPADTRERISIYSDRKRNPAAKVKSTAGKRAEVKQNIVIGYIISMFRHEVKVRTKKVAKKQFPLSACFIIMAFTVIFFTLIYSKIQLNEYSVQISEVNLSIKEEQRLLKIYEQMLADKMNLPDIEAEAVNKLGMVKKEMLPQKYITPNEKDSVEVKVAGDDSPVSSVSDTLFSMFKNLFKK